MKDQIVAKLFRAAAQRLTAAEFLLTNDALWLESMYIAGYGVEIDLKALLLHRTAPSLRASVFKEFRGAGWHDLLHLKKELEQKRCPFTADLMRHFTRVATWNTALRYEVGRKRYDEADLFLKSAKEIHTRVKEMTS